jgi:predicted lysophospholipase L1 biosynthesis ABC-type transport system permease subunit
MLETVTRAIADCVALTLFCGMIVIWAKIFEVLCSSGGCW